MAVSCSSSLVEPGPAALGVDPHDRARRPRGVGGRAAQQGPHPGEQLGEPERLGDVVVGAGVEPDDGVDLVGAGGEDEDRDRRGPRRGSGGTPRGRRCPAARGRGPPGRGSRLAPSRAARPSLADVDVVALAPQRAGQRLGDGGVVLGQQHSGHERRSSGTYGARRVIDRARATPGARRFSAKAATPSRRSPEKAVARQQASSTSSPVARSTSAPSRIARLAWRSPTGEFAATGRPARAPGRARCRPARPRRRTPSARASAAGSRRAVKISSAARDQPTRRVEQLGAAAAGDDADATSGRPTTAAVTGDDEVAGQGDLEPAAEREAVDGGDRGHGQVEDPAVCRARHRPLLHQVGVGEAVALLEVGPDAERLRAGLGSARRSAPSRVGGDAGAWPRRGRRAMAVETAFMASGRSRTSSATWPAVVVPR